MRVVRVRMRADEEHETQRTHRVPRNEGNEVKRDERREVGGAHSTEEVGELAPRGPGGGIGHPDEENRARERCQGP